MKKFKCIYCGDNIAIPLKVLNEAINTGKAVMECECCKKLLTVRNDEEDKVFIT